MIRELTPRDQVRLNSKSVQCDWPVADRLVSWRVGRYDMSLTASVTAWPVRRVASCPYNFGPTHLMGWTRPIYCPASIRSMRRGTGLRLILTDGPTANPPTAHPGWERWYFRYEKPDGTKVKVSADRDPQTGEWFKPHLSSSQTWP
jgi:hypothetical protein